MWCQENKQVLGMVRVETIEVIRACKRQLESIYAKRSKMKRDFIFEYFNSFTAKIWKFFRFPVTRRDALYAYYYDSHVPHSCFVSMIHGKQEMDCKNILRTAESVTSKSMWLSVEGIRACNL